MAITTSDILDILRVHNIMPEESFEVVDLPATEDIDFPEIGEIEEGETVYTTSLDEVFRADDDGEFDIFDPDSPRVTEWWGEIERIIGAERRFIWRRLDRQEPPEPHCAWYCPIHFFGHGWGIYIRESCILSHAVNIAGFVNWRDVQAFRYATCRRERPLVV